MFPSILYLIMSAGILMSTRFNAPKLLTINGDKLLTKITYHLLQSKHTHTDFSLGTTLLLENYVLYD